MKALILILALLLVSCSHKKWIYKKNLPETTTKLCFIGDVGVDSKTQEKVSEALKNEGCHWVHFLGDLVYPNGITSPKDPQFHQKFWKYYQELPQMFLILGNHDYRQDYHHWTKLSEKHPNLFFPNPYYLIKDKNICIVHLDTNYYKLFIHFAQASKQTSWLENLHPKMQSCKVKIALTHAPFKSRGKKHGEATGLVKDFLQEQIIGKFDYLISGHEHILSDEGVLKGTRMIISGAGGTPDLGEAAGYYVMEVETGKIISANFKIVKF